MVTLWLYSLDVLKVEGLSLPQGDSPSIMLGRGKGGKVEDNSNKFHIFGSNVRGLDLN